MAGFNPNNAVGLNVYFPKSNPEATIYVWDGVGSDAQTIGGDSGVGDTGMTVTAVTQDNNGNPWLEVDLTDSAHSGENGNVGYIPCFGDTSVSVPANTSNPMADSVFNDSSALQKGVAKGTTGGGGTPGANPKGGGGMGFFSDWNPFKINIKDDASDYHNWVKILFWIIVLIILARLAFHHKKK